MKGKFARKFSNVVQKVNDAKAALAVGTLMAIVGCPAPAYAAKIDDSTGMLSKVLNLAGDAVVVIGVLLAAWGGVTIGKALKDGQGGMGMTEGIGAIAGGGIIVVAGGFIKGANS